MGYARNNASTFFKVDPLFFGDIACSLCIVLTLIDTNPLEVFLVSSITLVPLPTDDFALIIFIYTLFLFPLFLFSSY
jgi:hypothetical protein